MPQRSFSSLLKEIHACDFCANYLRMPPKPVVQLNEQARILVIAQAPGIRARTSGLPFDDPSGDRLRTWLGVDRTVFYDPTKFAFMPMGFCYPGTKDTGDLPPCKDCAPRWHPKVMPYLVNIRLTLLVGVYAHEYYLHGNTVTQMVKSFREHLPEFLPLPHPSWHNNAWITKNPWFMDNLVPTLQKLIAHHLMST